MIEGMETSRSLSALVITASILLMSCGTSVSAPSGASTSNAPSITSTIAPTTTMSAEDLATELLTGRDASLARLGAGRSQVGDALVLHMNDETMAAAVEASFGTLTYVPESFGYFEPYGYWETIVQSEPVSDGSTMTREWTGGALVVEEFLLFGSAESAVRAKAGWVALARAANLRERDNGQPDGDLFTVTYDAPGYSCVAQTISSTNIAVVSVSLLYASKPCNSRSGLDSGYIAAVVKWYARGSTGWK